MRLHRGGLILDRVSSLRVIVSNLPIYLWNMYVYIFFRLGRDSPLFSLRLYFTGLEIK